MIGSNTLWRIVSVCIVCLILKNMRITKTPGSKCILQLRGVCPFLSDKYDITKHKNYQYLSDANPRNAFDIGKYVSKRLKVDPDEEFAYSEYVKID